MNNSLNVRAAVAQIDAKVGNISHNLEVHLKAAEHAVKENAGLIVFPELSLTGYSLKDLAWDVALDPSADPRFSQLVKMSRRISMVVGFVESGPRHGIYNSAAFLEDGEIKHIHRKLYPPTYGMFEEGRYFSAGKDLTPVDSKFGRIGLLICEDAWHVSLPYLLATAGAETICILTASPTRVAGQGDELENKTVNHEHHRTFARLLNTYILFSNRVGFEDGVNFWGGSAVTGPSGRQMVGAKLWDEDLIFADVESAEVARARRFSRHFLDEDPVLVQRLLERLNH